MNKLKEMSNIPPHLMFNNRRRKKRTIYIPPTEEEIIAKELKEAENRKNMRRDLARSILREDPEFLQELILELRQKKIEQIKK